MAIDKASVFRAALLQLDVDPEAVTAFDSAETEDEVHAAGAKLVEAAIERGRALVSHGEAQAKVDHNLQIKHLRKLLGGTDDENIVQLAGRVMTDLRNAKERPAVAPTPSVPDGGLPMVGIGHEGVRVKLGEKLFFHTELPPDGATWPHILAGVEHWEGVLRAIAVAVKMPGADQSNYLHEHDPRLLRNAVVDALSVHAADRFRPTIDEDDEGVVVADITALKQINDTFIKMTVRLVSPEDLQYLTLGRAWLRCNASEDIPL